MENAAHETLDRPRPSLNWGGAGYPAYVCLLKGDNSQQEMNQANQQQQLENSMAQQQYNAVSPAVQAIINNGGLAPQVQAAMTTNALNTLPNDFRSAAGAINNSLVARGISGGAAGAGSGDVARNFGSLGAMEDMLKSNALNSIQLAKQQGLNSALGMGSNLFSNANQGQQSALNSGVTAANNVDQAQTGIWGSLIGAGASLGGAAMGRKW